MHHVSPSGTSVLLYVSGSMVTSRMMTPSMAPTNFSPVAIPNASIVMDPVSAKNDFSHPSAVHPV
jgi:hypothetical protein